MKRSPAISSFFVGIPFLCAGCVTAPDVTLPIENSAPVLQVPSSTRFLGQASVYISTTGEKMEIIPDSSAGVAIIKLPDGGMAVLPAEIAGSEGRYRDSRMTVWENEGNALLWIDGKLVFSGRLQ